MQSGIKVVSPAGYLVFESVIVVMVVSRIFTVSLSPNSFKMRLRVNKENHLAACFDSMRFITTRR